MNTQITRTWVEVSENALISNYTLFKNLVGENKKIMVVVKSNAYGHGIVETATLFKNSDFLAVDDVGEGLLLRSSKIKTPILVFGYTDKNYFIEASKKKISLTIADKDALLHAVQFATKKPLKIHIKVDTGLHRQGFQKHEMSDVITLLKTKSKLVVEGLYTHLAAAETPRHSEYTQKQIHEFAEWQRAFNEIGLKPLVHSSASAATMLSPHMHFDMVRVGISLYGLWASKEVEQMVPQHKLIPALTWKTIIGGVKQVKAGEPIGYDLTESLIRDTAVAICPVGYWHGVPRSLSSVGEVLVGGKRAKILGRVSMDMIAIDVTGFDTKQGDEVVLIGAEEGARVSADEWAEKAGTINYEIVTRINPLIPREFVD